jgi:hypothetical protein
MFYYNLIRILFNEGNKHVISLTLHFQFRMIDLRWHE